MVKPQLVPSSKLLFGCIRSCSPPSSSSLDPASLLHACCPSSSLSSSSSAMAAPEEKTSHFTPPHNALSLHSYLCETGLDTIPASPNHLLLISALLEDDGRQWSHYAHQALTKLVCRPDSASDSLIIFCVANGKPHFALLLFDGMQKEHPSLQPSEHAFVSLIKACIALADLHAGTRIHQVVEQNGMLERNVFINSSLVDMYCKCKVLAKAQHVFDMISVRDTVSWTALLSGYGENGQVEEALTCFKRMQLHCALPNAVTFICCTKSCQGIKYLLKAKQVHVMLETLGLLPNNLNAANALIHMYMRCGSLSMARSIFDGLLIRDVISWTTLLNGYVECGLSAHALKCFEEMQIEGVHPNNVSFICSLKACFHNEYANKAQEIHSQIEKCGLLDGDLTMGNTLVDIYAKCGLLDMAQKVFDKLPNRNEVSWSTLVAGYASQGHGQEALECFKKMRMEHVSPDAVTFICSLKACACIGATDLGREIHAEIEQQGLLDSNITIGNTLIYMYVTFRTLAKAEQVFERLPLRNIVTWNALISGCIECDQSVKAQKCLEQMQIEGVYPDAITFACCLKACGSVVDINMGEQIHDMIHLHGTLENNIVVGNALVHMYMECGSSEKAQNVFDILPIRNTVSWNALIAGYVELGHVKKALDCLEHMQVDGVSPDAVTLICCLKACGMTGEIEKGKDIHDYVEHQGLPEKTTIGNALVGMYARTGALMKAQEVFERLPVPDVVSWNALISACTELGHYDETMRLFEVMLVADTTPDVVTFIFVLKCCGKLGAVAKGLEIHDAIERRGLIENNVTVSCGLVEMYASLGSIVKAQEVFDNLRVRGVVLWTALLAGYAELGDFENVLHLFRNMESEGTHPDSVTFIVVLNACGRVGMFSKGQMYLEMMSKDYGIDPMLEHYACIVDALSRVGHLEKAVSVALKMPESPDLVVWHSLLAACKYWGNFQIGKQALSKLVQRLTSCGLKPVQSYECK